MDFKLLLNFAVCLSAPPQARIQHMFRREEAIDVVESYDAIDSPFKVAAARRTL